MEDLDHEHQDTPVETPHMEGCSENQGSPLIERASTSLGNLLIRVGTRLKERGHVKLTTEEDQPPSFIIML